MDILVCCFLKRIGLQVPLGIEEYTVSMSKAYNSACPTLCSHGHLAFVLGKTVELWGLGEYVVHP